MEDWQAKTLRRRHVVMRGETLICEGIEVRAFVHRDPAAPDRLPDMPIPEDLKALCL